MAAAAGMMGRRVPINTFLPRFREGGHCVPKPHSMPRRLGKVLQGTYQSRRGLSRFRSHALGERVLG